MRCLMTKPISNITLIASCFDHRLYASTCTTTGAPNIATLLTGTLASIFGNSMLTLFMTCPSIPLLHRQQQLLQLAHNIHLTERTLNSPLLRSLNESDSLAVNSLVFSAPTESMVSPTSESATTRFLANTQTTHHRMVATRNLDECTCACLNFIGAVETENLPGKDKYTPESRPRHGGVKFRNVVALHRKARAVINCIEPSLLLRTVFNPLILYEKNDAA
jgi:hypothetical protein